MTQALHLYALLDAPAAEMPAGAFGEQLVQIDLGGVVAVAGAVETEPTADEAAALAHAGVVEALASRADALLPSRFGAGFADAALLARAVEQERDRLAQALERVRGCAELGLRALFPPSDAPPAHSGREYLQRRAAEAARLRRVVDDVHRPLAERARDARSSESLAPLALRASYLVPREDVEPFALEARRRAAAVPAAAVFVHGPWPPYSFGDGGAS